jgi:chitin synthase
MSGNRQSTAGLQQAHDLAALPGLQDDVVVACLRERFMADTIYTRIGPAALVAVNPHKYVASDGDAVLHSYAQEFRDTQPGRTPLAPHVFQLANNAYYHMRRTAQDQCILMMYVSRPVTADIYSRTPVATPAAASPRTAGSRSRRSSSSP